LYGLNEGTPAFCHLNRAIVAVSEGKPNEALPDLEKASSINQTKEVLEVAQQELKKESQGNATKTRLLGVALTSANQIRIDQF
jgi:hypothetical protein